MSQAPLLEVENLKLHFHFRKGSIRAVDGVSFKVNKGETLGLVGESGCGKSTTARAIAQLHKPQEGRVLVSGQDLCCLRPKDLLIARRHIQMVFQDPFASLDPRMTAKELIAEPLRIYKFRGIEKYAEADINKRVSFLLDKVGLAQAHKDRHAHEFSGGQRQRIGIARALALGPDLILADEPVSALDVSIQAQILNLFKDLQDELGLTYLFIAHDLAVVEYISHRIAVMYLGKIVEIADASHLYKNPKHPYSQALLSAVPVPDPVVERSRKRILLTGDLPSPEVEQRGCPFYDRCPKKMDLCANAKPALKTTDDGHEVACFLY